MDKNRRVLNKPSQQPCPVFNLDSIVFFLGSAAVQWLWFRMTMIFTTLRCSSCWGRESTPSQGHFVLSHPISGWAGGSRGVVRGHNWDSVTTLCVPGDQKAIPDHMAASWMITEQKAGWGVVTLPGDRLALVSRQWVMNFTGHQLICIFFYHCSYFPFLYCLFTTTHEIVFFLFSAPSHWGEWTNGCVVFKHDSPFWHPPCGTQDRDTDRSNQSMLEQIWY